MAAAKYTAPNREKRRKFIRDILHRAGGELTTKKIHAALEASYPQYCADFGAP